MINRIWIQGESQIWGICPLYNQGTVYNQGKKHKYIPRVSTFLMLQPSNTTPHVVVTPTIELFHYYFITIIFLL